MFKKLRHIILLVFLMVSIKQTIAQSAMPDTVCIGATKRYQVNDPSVPSTYTWKIDGVIQTVTKNEISITWNTPGSHQITVQERSASGCDGDVRSGVVFVNNLPTADISGGGALCAGTSTTIDVALTGKAPWTLVYTDGTSTFTNTSITVSPHKIVVSPAVNTTYSLVNVADVNCSNTATGLAMVSVSKPIQPIRYPTITAKTNMPQLLTARVITTSDNYLWNPSFGLNNSQTKNPIFNYDKPVEYFIEINAATGCTVIDTLLVKVAPVSNKIEIYVPAGFTPNGDGHNDFLMPVLYNIKELKYFRVYNRWGQTIFETTVPGKGWDGKFKGLQQDAAIFIWSAEATGNDGSLVIRKGITTLIR